VIAVDSSVLLDLLVADSEHGEASARALIDALSVGDVVLSDAVVAEVQTLIAGNESAIEALSDYGIRYLPTSEQAAVRAGFMQRRYRDRGGKRQRVVADFLIGAHAMMQCSALITRDAGFYRDYFKGLKLIVPKA
jgi:predicted nucleic acid-binding protein